MTQNNTALYIGGGLGLLFLAMMRKQPPTPAIDGEGEATDEGEVRGSAGFAPATDAVSAIQRHYADDCRHGSLYAPRKGDIVLGRGPKSVCWRALASAAHEADIPDPETWADATDRKVAYARLLCAGNADHLTTEDLHPKAFRDDEGRGLCLDRIPALWLPLLALEPLEYGIVATTQWEDDSSTIFMPPELREAFALGGEI